MNFFGIGLHHDHINTVNRTNIHGFRYKYGYLLIFACFFLYMSSMAAKGIFAAEQKYIVDLWNLQYSEASMANTFYFVPYGLAQFLLFAIMKKINIFKYLFITVPFAVLATLLIGFSQNIYQIWIYFGLSGYFQAGIYCTCNYALTQNLPSRLCSTANRIMNLGYAVGTVIAYGICAICIGNDLWRLPYFIIGTVFFSSIVIFAVVLKKARRFRKINEILDAKANSVVINNTKSTVDNTPLFLLNSKKKLAIFYVLELSFAFVITALYYGIMNYITSLLVDVHHLPDDVSIFVSILAPLTIAIGPMTMITICDKKKNFVQNGIIASLITLPIPLLLALFYDLNVVFALALSVVYVVMLNSIKAIPLSISTFIMKKQINSAGYSAISNAVASLSAGVAPTVIGKIIDVYGWSVSYYVLFITLAFTIVMAIFVNILIKRSSKKSLVSKN